MTKGLLCNVLFGVRWSLSSELLKTTTEINTISGQMGGFQRSLLVVPWIKSPDLSRDQLRTMLKQTFLWQSIVLREKLILDLHAQYVSYRSKKSWQPHIFCGNVYSRKQCYLSRHSLLPSVSWFCYIEIINHGIVTFETPFISLNFLKFLWMLQKIVFLIFVNVLVVFKLFSNVSKFF